MVPYPIEDFPPLGLQMNQQDVEEYWEEIEPGFCLLFLNISLFTKLWSFLIKWSLYYPMYHDLEAVFFFTFQILNFLHFLTFEMIQAIEWCIWNNFISNDFQLDIWSQPTLSMDFVTKATTWNIKNGHFSIIYGKCPTGKMLLWHIGNYSRRFWIWISVG